MKNKTKTISSVLKELIEQKSIKDNAQFTASQLAEAIGVHRSVITKLIQDNPDKRVSNPRVDTLIKIVTFFKKGGVNITLDELVGV